MQLAAPSPILGAALGRRERSSVPALGHHRRPALRRGPRGGLVLPLVDPFHQLRLRDQEFLDPQPSTVQMTFRSDSLMLAGSPDHSPDSFPALAISP